MARSDLHQAAILGQQKTSTPFILTSVANLESQINLTLHAFGLWDELDYLERTHAGRARTSKLHTGVLASDQELIWSEAAMATTALLLHPLKKQKRK